MVTLSNNDCTIRLADFPSMSKARTRRKYLIACGTNCRRLYVGMMQETRGKAIGMTSLSRRSLKACYVSLSRKTTIKARSGPASPCWVAGGEQEGFQIHLLIPAREQYDQALAQPRGTLGSQEHVAILLSIQQLIPIVDDAEDPIHRHPDAFLVGLQARLAEIALLKGI